eukprot:COSAG06_NODE_1840_length_8239_cov_3.113145_5_plen_192_part_00
MRQAAALRQVFPPAPLCALAGAQQLRHCAAAAGAHLFQFLPAQDIGYADKAVPRKEALDAVEVVRRAHLVPEAWKPVVLPQVGAQLLHARIIYASPVRRRRVRLAEAAHPLCRDVAVRIDGLVHRDALVPAESAVAAAHDGAGRQLRRFRHAREPEKAASGGKLAGTGTAPFALLHRVRAHRRARARSFTP